MFVGLWTFFPLIQLIIGFVFIVYILFTQNIKIVPQLFLALVYTFTSTYAKLGKAPFGDVLKGDKINPDFILNAEKIYNTFTDTLFSNCFSILILFYIVEQIVIKAVRISTKSDSENT